MQTQQDNTPPQIGMLATVRNRRGVVSGVRPYGEGSEEVIHLVDVEYNDGETPYRESLLWELEPNRRLIPATALPPVASAQPMDPAELTALIRACRWSAQSPYVDPDGSGPLDRLPIASPFHGAIQTEDFQLVPLLKAMRMPRVSLLLADDVGLGKTIEAGLILTELILRRRIRRVLILTPATLRVQWRDELEEKFSLPFEIVDRESTVDLRRQLGMDANPWRSHSRIIASYHYLKQPNVLEEFRAASTPERESAHLPWDLLIVDEAHNLTPAPIGEESDLCQMLRQVSPLFEHRLFLTATPHNGHTRSFTGLLEMLDPVRFSQTNELEGRERERVEDVVVRRLKREINERNDPPPFCSRLDPKALDLDLSPAEHELSQAFEALRAKIRSLLAEGTRKRRLAGNFAIEILGKRLLSCPVAFADSWWRSRAGLEEDESVSEDEVLAAQRSVEEETVDDREAESRSRAASSTVGAWLRPLAQDLGDEFEAIDAALTKLELPQSSGEMTEVDPAADSRYEALLELIERRLRPDGSWRDDERLVIFTEYKTTLDYLLRRLRTDFDDECILCLFGGMTDAERDPVKFAFNDPAAEVRILVGTDAASEGLNLQKTARYVLHYDVPWNPARLEQRNGRLDRHGQARDVQTWHFVSSEDHDLRFLAHVVGKVHTIREDLGATSEVFDEITHRRLVEGESAEDLQRELDTKVEAVKDAAAMPRDDQANTSDEEGEKAAVRLEALAAELDYNPATLHETLAIALGLHREHSPLARDSKVEEPVYRLKELPPFWERVINDSLRRPGTGSALGALPALAFDSSIFIDHSSGRPVFRPRPDTVLLHLAHAMIRRAIQVLARRRFPGQDMVSRWTIRHGAVPEGCDALFLLTVEELAVNELRETFHHWVRTLRLPVRDGRLAEALEHVPARSLPHGDQGDNVSPQSLVAAAFDLWEGTQDDLKELLATMTEELSGHLAAQLEADGERALSEAKARYQSRHGEISVLIESSTLAKLEREIEELQENRRQGRLAYASHEIDRLDRDLQVRQEELQRRKRHYEELRDELGRERDRMVNELIPKRYSMRGSPQVLPIAIEILLPELPPEEGA